jgi:hypothetical protein
MSGYRDFQVPKGVCFHCLVHREDALRLNAAVHSDVTRSPW